MRVNKIIDGAIIEITNLQNKVEKLTEELKKYNTSQETPKDE